MTVVFDPSSEGVACLASDARHATVAAGTLVGYARAFDQPAAIAAQVRAFEALGCAEVFSDDAKGASIYRPGFADAASHLKAGDCLVVMSLERLAWRHDLLLEIAAELAAKDVHLWSLSDNFDTRVTGHGLSIIKALHGFAASVRQARSDEALAVNPNFKVSNAAIAAVEARISRGEMTAVAGAALLGVHRSTFYRRRAAA